MDSEPMNILYICSDEHSKEKVGSYDNPIVQTPNLDSLAENGVRFTNAYCNSPVCVPSRASLATGRYIHDIRNWDNAMPYTGQHPSWGQRLIEQDFQVTTIGKLHYRKVGDNTGFPDQRLPMHVLDGIGDVYSLIRDNLEPRQINRQKILEAGSGETSYIRYDRGITEEAQQFLNYDAQHTDKPWALFLSYATPHFPLVVPEEYYNLYPLEDVIFPKQYGVDQRPMHPVLEAYRHIWATDDEFDEMTVRKAVAAYYGLCTFLDEQIGIVLKTLKESGLSQNTRIIYTSDHGDTLGDHGVWFKSTMYEGSVGVPFIMAGPDLPKGKVTDTPISLIDSFPTIINGVGATFNKGDKDLPGTDLLPIAKGEQNPDRVIFSEYHAMGFITAAYMIKKRQYKYIYYLNYRPQLFDLKNDPDELCDLSNDNRYKQIKQECEYELHRLIDPNNIDQLARNDQEKLICQHGGREFILKEGFKVVYSPVPEQFK